MIKRRIDSSFSWLYLTNNTIAWKGLQALLTDAKTNQRERENRSAKLGVKANQIRKGEREKNGFQGSAIEKI